MIRIWWWSRIGLHRSDRMAGSIAQGPGLEFFLKAHKRNMKGSKEKRRRGLRKRGSSVCSALWKRCVSGGAAVMFNPDTSGRTRYQVPSFEAAA
jgi:hypothetical protein